MHTDVCIRLLRTRFFDVRTQTNKCMYIYECVYVCIDQTVVNCSRSSSGSNDISADVTPQLSREEEASCIKKEI